MDYFLTKRYSSYSNEDMINEQYSWWKKKLYQNAKINYLDLFKKKIDISQSPGKKVLTSYLSLKKENDKLKFASRFKELLIEKELGINSSKLVCIEHHECHAYYSICNDDVKNKKCLIFTVDGSR